MNTNIIQTLKPSLLKNSLPIICNALLIAVGIVNILNGNTTIGILCIVFFSLCLGVLIVNLLPKATLLEITENGFYITTLFRKRFIPWEAVTHFDSSWLFFLPTAYYHLTDEAQQAMKFKVNRLSLPNTFGMSAKKLAQTLNDFKSKHRSE